MERSVEGFSATIASRLAKVSYRQLDYWDKTGLVRPSVAKARGKGSRRVYAFEDIVELRVVARLLALGIKLSAVREAARFLAKHHEAAANPLARLSLVVEGKKVLARIDEVGPLVDVTAGGQVVITVPVGVIAAEVKQTVVDISAPRRVAVRVRGSTYEAVLTPDLRVGGYTVEVPALPGVLTEGDSVADAKRNAVEAIELWLEVESETKSPRRRKSA